MIRFDNVSKRYANGHDALKNINLQIQPAQMCFLTGHSGAGKSSLLRLLTLMERPSQGEVYVNDHCLNQLGAGAIPYLRRQMGVIFQDHRLLHDRNVFENVALPLIIAGYSELDIGKRVRAALDKVGLLKKEKLYPIALSGGEQQRVGIARAVVNKPSILLADEPTGNLDPSLSAEIMGLFEQFNQVGVTVLVASHDLALIAQMRHGVITLSEGRVVSGGAHAA